MNESNLIKKIPKITEGKKMQENLIWSVESKKQKKDKKIANQMLTSCSKLLNVFLK